MQACCALCGACSRLENRPCRGRARLVRCVRKEHSRRRSWRAAARRECSMLTGMPPPGAHLEVLADLLQRAVVALQRQQQARHQRGVQRVRARAGGAVGGAQLPVHGRKRLGLVRHLALDVRRCGPRERVSGPCPPASDTTHSARHAASRSAPAKMQSSHSHERCAPLHSSSRLVSCRSDFSMRSASARTPATYLTRSSHRGNQKQS